ncbi:hypothetical protein [Streptomyces sp.]|uniref:hypothetical protein n=1 Tax=Streptomyces sp. TaxID=1931 RepID=UPI0028117DA2|nr:hypothetical protein [Streptomyces sp.]
MTHNDKPINGQDNPSFLDLFNQLPPVPPAPELDGQHGAGRLAWLRAAWKASWEEGGFLYERWAGPARQLVRDRHLDQSRPPVRRAQPHRADAGRRRQHHLRHAHGPVQRPGHQRQRRQRPVGTVDYPVRVFLADQAAHLAVAPAALYAFWQLTGLLGLVGGFFGNAGARIAWLLFGIGSLAMI